MTIGKILEELGLSNKFLSTHDLLNTWKEVIEDCFEGYEQNIHELDYDLRIRGEIDLLIKHEDFNKLEKSVIFINEIHKLDEDFQSLIKFISNNDVEKEFWKRKFHLKKAGSIYKESVLREFGINIDV